MKNNLGFTLIELILVIAILGILAVAVAPQFVDIQSEAHQAQAKGVAGAVRDGVNMFYARELATTGTGTYPLVDLDAAANGACTVANPCFSDVLKNTPSSGWTKAGAVYTHTGSGWVYTYDPDAGTFNCPDED